MDQPTMADYEILRFALGLLFVLVIFGFCLILALSDQAKRARRERDHLRQRLAAVEQSRPSVRVVGGR